MNIMHRDLCTGAGMFTVTVDEYCMRANGSEFILLILYALSQYFLFEGIYVTANLWNFIFRGIPREYH